MNYPCAILSDQHCHAWSQFAFINKDGINSRLQIILDEMLRAAEFLKRVGGSDMIFAGDLFHQRGTIKPSVFNPTYDCIRKICAMGITIHAIPGNHDLEGKTSEALGNAMQSLNEIDNFHVVTSPKRLGDIILVPWMEDIADIETALIKHSEGQDRSNLTAVIHAPVNGVIKGIPDIGLDAMEIDKLGFNAVLAGHFHNHKKVSKTVWSIGATTHQTWNDPESKAGFIILDDTGVVEFEESAAPKFLNFSDTCDPDVIKGNYVRIQGVEVSEKEVKELKELLVEAGAIGIVDHSSRKPEASRRGVTVKTGSSLEQSVSDFIETTPHLEKVKSEVQKECLDILSEAKSA